MNSVFVDSALADDERRRLIYEGQLFVYSPTPSSVALCEFAWKLCKEAFAPFDPRDAQFAMHVEQYADILKVLKPKFSIGEHGHIAFFKDTEGNKVALHSPH